MFTYLELLEDIEFLRFAGLEVGSIGKSEAGYDIPYAFYGDKKGRKIIVMGGIHARENVSSLMVIRQAFLYAKKAVEVSGGIYFVPILNVDGCILIEKGADFFPCRRDFLLSINGGNRDFSLWKANINAVDLNTNFDADFSKGKSNKFKPAPSDYVGKSPFDQAETRALRDFTLLVKPDSTISYHALGRELYWYFNQEETKERDNKIAEKLNRILKYKKVDSTLDSAGGYKDWCVQKLGMPAFTIEIGDESLSHPLAPSDIEPDWLVNKYLPKHLLDFLA